MNKLVEITQDQIDSCSVSKLPTRPNATPAMGGLGFSSKDLRERFDALAMLAIGRINNLIEAVNGGASEKTSITYSIDSGISNGDGNYSLGELLDTITTGTFADILYVKLGEDGQSLDTWLEYLHEQVQNVAVDEEYKPESTKAQSGKAVADAIKTVECLTVTEPITFKYPSIAELTKKDEYGFLSYSNSFHIDSFNRPPVAGELFVRDCVSSDGIPCTIIAQVKKINDQGFAEFKIVSLQLTNQDHFPDSTNPESGLAVSQAIDMLFGEAEGEIIRAEHVSPIEHDVTVTIDNPNLFDTSKIKTTDRISVSDGKIIVESSATDLVLPAATGRLLKEFCPELKPGIHYVLSIESSMADDWDCIYVGEKKWIHNESLEITADLLNEEVSFVSGLVGQTTIESISVTLDTSKIDVIRYGETDKDDYGEYKFTGNTCTFRSLSPKMTIKTDKGLKIRAKFNSAIGVSGGGTIADPEYNSNSTNAQSGKAVAQAVSGAVSEAKAYTDARATVQSVNGQKGAVNLSAADVGARPSSWTPTYSDVGADKAGTASGLLTQHNTDTTAHNDIRIALEGLSDRINAALNSTDTDLDQLSEIVAYIKSNKSLIEAITTSKVSVANIINNLTTSALDKPLSAAQGVKLKSLIDALSDAKLDKSALTNAINQALALAKSSGDFNGFSPTVSVSKLNGVTTVTINDILGPQTATINDGASVSIKRISESDDDGGENTVTFTSNGTDKTLTIKNGTQGSPGVGIKSVKQTTTTSADDGVNKLTITTTDDVSTDFFVKNGSKGSPGTTPVKGVDYFTETDLQEIVVRCVDAIKEGGVVGVVDEDKNILLSGNLEDGTYTLSYEREDGTVCGTTLVITAPIAEPKNFFVIDGEGYILNGRCNNEGLDRQDTGAYIVTNYMDVQAGDIIRLSGAPLAQVEAAKSGMKLTNGSLVGFTHDNTEFISNGTAVNGVTEFTINKADVDAVRLCLCLLVANGNTSKPIDNAFVENQNIVINIQRDGVWLTK